MSEKEIQSIESELLDLGVEGDKQAAALYADLCLFRRNFERARSVETRQELDYQAREAHAWLTGGQYTQSPTRG